MPSDDNAAVRISRALERLAQHPFPARLDGPTAAMFEGIAPYSRGTMRMALANRWLLGPFVKSQLLASPDTAAAVRTTTAPTIVSAGTKDNVLPQFARAVVNHRILPGDTVDSVLAYDRKIIDDPKVQVRALQPAHNPSRPVSANSAEYEQLTVAIRTSFPEAAVAPGLVLGATDGRHYEGVARGVLRFSPITMRKTDVARFHGNDERIGIGDYMRAIAFYERLISASPPPGN